MGSYDSMKSKLAPLHLYTLAAGSAVDHELKAYACGLDPLFDALDEEEREGFIATAESYGLSEREKFLEKEKPQLSTERRRALLMGFEKENHGAGTLGGFLRYLADIGLTQVSIQETPLRQYLQISVGDVLDEGQKTLVVEKLRQAVPLHLNVHVYLQSGETIVI